MGTTSTPAPASVVLYTSAHHAVDDRHVRAAMATRSPCRWRPASTPTATCRSTT